MENEQWKTIGDALKEARRSLELSQRHTGVTLGMQPSLYVAVEEGVANPAEVLKRLFELIGEYEGALKALRKNAREDAEKVESLLVERDEAIADRDILRINAQKEDVHHDRLLNELERVYKERDEARNECKGLWAMVDTEKKKAYNALRERDEAREAAARWESSFEAMECAGAEQAQRADANREWALRAERERDEAREELARITEAASAVLDRWEQPAWKDTEPTAAVIYRLRDALGRGEK